jgi:uncharacterized membrane protein
MKKNMGKVDRILRAIVALVLIALYFTNTLTGTIGLVVVIFAGVMLLTSVIGNCPPYSLLGINTCKVKEQKQ